MADRKARIAVIGLGDRGLYLASLFHRNERSEVVAVSDIDAERIAMARNKWGDDFRYYTNNADLLAADDIDGVVVATHDVVHEENAIEVFRAGHSLLLEKPMAQTVAQCDNIIKAWREAGTLFMIGLELRHCVLFTRLRELIDDGVVGDIKLGWAVDNVSVGGDYFYHNKWRRKDFVGSLLIQKGVHTIDLMNWYMGGRPTRVFALGGLDVFGGDAPDDKCCRDCGEKDTCNYFVEADNFVMDYGANVRMDDRCVYAQECDVNDNSVVTIEYDTGKRAQFVECHFTPEYTREFTFIGDKGKVYAFYNNDGNFRIRAMYRHSDHVDEWYPVFRGGAHGGGDIRLVEDFLDCLLEGKQPLADIAAARESTAVAVAAEESMETGAPVEIPPCPYLQS